MSLARHTALIPWLLAWVLAGCGGGREAPIDLERMIVQPRLETYGESDFFADGRAMREPPEGTLSIESEVASEESRSPVPDRALLRRGQDRFGVFCAPCHGLDGRARTPVAESMELRPPPSLLEPRIREQAPQAIHRVILDGFGLMPAYRGMLDARAAWGVAYYVRALQRSAATPIDELPEGVRRRALRALGSSPSVSPARISESTRETSEAAETTSGGGEP